MSELEQQQILIKGPNELLNLLNVNSNKMTFQQNMTFQLRNWSLILTLGILTIVWRSFSASDPKIKIPILVIRECVIHLSAICVLIFIYFRDRRWHLYFLVFRERVILIENILLGKLKIDVLEEGYYKYIQSDGKFSKKEDLLNAFPSEKFPIEYLELLMIGILLLSLSFRLILLFTNLNVMM